VESGNTLQHMIYGCLIDSDQPVLLASSTDLPQSVISEWRRVAVVDAIDTSETVTQETPDAAVSLPQTASQAVGLFPLRNGSYLFARAAQDTTNRTEACTIYEYVQLTRDDLNTIAGNVGLLAEHLFYDPIPSFATPYQSLNPYRLPSTPTWSFDRRVAVIEHLVSTYGKGDLSPLLIMLSAALSEQELLITRFPGTSAERLLLVQGLLMLLPVFARLEMTFTTHTTSTDAEMLRRVRIVFRDMMPEALSSPVNTIQPDTESSEGVTLVSGSSEAAALNEAARWQVDFQGSLDQLPDMPTWEMVKNPYTEALESIWQKGKDTRSLVTEIRAMELSQGTIPDREPFQTAMAQIAAAYLQDQRVMIGETLPIEQILVALDRITPANGDFYQRYMMLLLEYAMEQRDTDTALRVTLAMDQDADLDQKLNQMLQSNLESQPDAVYFVIRTHLASLLNSQVRGASAPSTAAASGNGQKAGSTSNGAVTTAEQEAVPQSEASKSQTDSNVTEPENANTGIPETTFKRWLPRLRQAALDSLNVASTDSDNETLLNWLRLIVREPSDYHLSDVLQNGITAVQNRAHSDGQLGFQLLQITARRVPETLETLLQDEALTNSLNEPLKSALQQYDPQAVQELLTLSRILYSTTLTQAANAATTSRTVISKSTATEKQNSDSTDIQLDKEDELPAQVPAPHTVPDAAPTVSLFTPEVIEQIWLLYVEDSAQTSVMQPYHPGRLLQILVTDGLNWLPSASLTRLLTLMLGSSSDDPLRVYLPDLIRAASQQEETSLAVALQLGGIAQESVLNIVGNAVNNAALSPRQAVNTYLYLMDAQGWNKAGLPIAEQIARTLQHNANVHITAEQSWKMLTFGSENRSELITRVIARRAFNGVEKQDSEKTLIDQFVRLNELTSWNAGIRQVVLSQWREFCRQQTTTRLQQLDKLLEGRKPLEEARNVLETVLAVRRVFNKRSFEEFADAVAMTHSILQGLSDAFDPAPKHTPALDPVTLRQELDLRREEITPDERRVLAKNLKELNSLITLMNEHRSRATLIRREEELERQLLSGEYTPQSAMDMLKWLSGYLDDTHKPPKS
jgi:hypothetical protein